MFVHFIFTSFEFSNFILVSLFSGCTAILNDTYIKIILLMLVYFSRLHFFSHRKIKRTESIQSLPSLLSNLVINAVVTSVNNINDKFVKGPTFTGT